MLRLEAAEDKEEEVEEEIYEGGDGRQEVTCMWWIRGFNDGR